MSVYRFLVASLPLLFPACAEQEGVQRTTTGPIEQTAAWTIDPPKDLNSFFECLEDAGVTLVSAHRGGPYNGLPENSLAAMQALLSDIPAIMEIDVATSSDGILYLMHDDTLERTTTGHGAANDMTWEQISRLSLEDNAGKTTPYAPSRFDETLSWAEGRTILQIDFKRSTRYEDVMRVVNDQDAEDRIILIAYSMASASKLHRLMPGAMISLSVNSQSELNRAVAAGVPAERLLGFTGTEEPRERLFSLLNNRDVEVIFGTLGGGQSIDRNIARSGDDDRYSDIAAMGVDILATDRPREAHAALARSGRGATHEVCGIRNSGTASKNF